MLTNLTLILTYKLLLYNFACYW